MSIGSPVVDVPSLCAVLDAGPDAAVLVDQDGLVVRATERLEALTGVSVSRVAGLEVDALVHPDYRARFTRRRLDVASSPGRRTAGFPVVLGHEHARVSVRAWLAEVEGSGWLVAWFREPPAPARRATEQEQGQESGQDSGQESDQSRWIRAINDEVLQSLATASYAHQRGDVRKVSDALEAASASARQIVERVGGGVAVDALARARPSLAAPPPSVADLATPHTGVVRVVVADDTAAVRAQVRSILRAVEGVDVVAEAGDGEEAVEVALRERPDLMLVDLSMPGRSGFEVLAAVREGSPGTRLVALSGFSREQAAVEALRHGATAYIEKGGAVGRFAALVDDLFPQRTRTRAVVDPVEGDRAGAGGELISLYAHELRRPISAQVMAAELLLDLPGLPAEAEALVQRVLDNAGRMDRLVQGVCDADRVGSGNLNLVVEPVDLLGLLRTTLDGLGHVLAPERVEVRRRCEPVVAADPGRVRQVVENLLTNAVKFGPVGGTVEVDVRASDEVAVLEVGDHGPGIAPAQRELAFERFERLGTQVAGIGLGLYLSRELARAQGGDLTVVDGLAPGATFRLTLPLFEA